MGGEAQWRGVAWIANGSCCVAVADYAVSIVTLALSAHMIVAGVV